MKLCDIYKIIYDGIGSRELKVKDQCLEYIRWNIFGKRISKPDTTIVNEDGTIVIQPGGDVNDEGKKLKEKLLNFLEIF